MFTPDSDGPQMLAARFAFQLKFGRMPQTNLQRACGNKMCIRPDHMSDVIFVKEKTEPLPWTDLFCAKIAPPDENGCWLYGKHPDRYGFFTRGRQETAHRVSWEMYNGPIPDGLWVLHHCDKKACVNPEHLYVGTAQDNINDRTRRGRHRQGSSLTEEEKSIILLSSASTNKLSRALGRGYATILRFRKDPNRKPKRQRGPGVAQNTHCLHGHEWTPENSYTSLSHGRQCKACNRAAKARQYAKKKGKAA